jgi:soluble P-type ATPase
MITFNIPGQGELQLAHLVLDYNGTLAIDGRLIPGVAERLAALGEQMAIYVVTADTFGTVKATLSGTNCEIAVLPATEPQDEAKRAFVRNLGEAQTAAIGNGRNDRLMLETAALGMAVIQQEGTAKDALFAADVVATDILSALDLLANPLRLAATLRI